MPCPSADHYRLPIDTVPMARTVNAIWAMPSPWSATLSTADASLRATPWRTLLTMGNYQNDVEGDLSFHCTTAVL